MGHGSFTVIGRLCRVDALVGCFAAAAHHPTHGHHSTAVSHAAVYVFWMGQNCWSLQELGSLTSYRFGGITLSPSGAESVCGCVCGGGGLAAFGSGQCQPTQSFACCW
jgi:hypothetical protein